MGRYAFSLQTVLDPLPADMFPTVMRVAQLAPKSFLVPALASVLSQEQGRSMASKTLENVVFKIEQYLFGII